MPNQSNGNTDLAEILEILQMRMCSQDDNFPDLMFKITLYFYGISITVSVYRKILFELRSARFSFISMFLRLTLTSVEKDMNQPAFMKMTGIEYHLYISKAITFFEELTKLLVKVASFLYLLSTSGFLRFSRKIKRNIGLEQVKYPGSEFLSKNSFTKKSEHRAENSPSQAKIFWVL